MTTGRKYSSDKLFAKISHGAESGVVGSPEYEVLGEVKLSVASTFTTSGTLTVQGRIKNSDLWQTIGALTSGGDFDSFDIDIYDYIRFNFSVAAGSAGEIAASGFFKASASGSGGGAGNSFTTIQTDAGTSPSADSSSDVLTLTSSDGSVTITGNSTSDTIDITTSASGGGGLNYYTESFLTTTWNGPISGYYFITVPQSNHAKTGQITVKVYEDLGSILEEVETFTQINGSLDVTIRISSTTDTRFNGKILIL